MQYDLRPVQHFNLADERTLMAFGRQFAELERRQAEFPKGGRLRPLTAREPRHSLISECERLSPAANEALATLSVRADHARLFHQQAPTMLDRSTEIL